MSKPFVLESYLTVFAFYSQIRSKKIFIVDIQRPRESALTYSAGTTSCGCGNGARPGGCNGTIEISVRHLSDRREEPHLRVRNARAGELDLRGKIEATLREGSSLSALSRRKRTPHSGGPKQKLSLRIRRALSSLPPVPPVFSAANSVMLARSTQHLRLENSPGANGRNSVGIRTSRKMGGACATPIRS